MEKQRWEESERRRKETRRLEKRKSEKKEKAVARKGRKVAIQCVFPMICCLGWSKSRLAKVAGAEPSGERRDEKLHAVVARSTFASERAKDASGPDHFWALRCGKNAHRCGAKQISKSKCEEHHMLGPLLDVQILFCVAGARDSASCRKDKNEQDVRVSGSFDYNHHKTTLRYNYNVQLQLHYTTIQPLHSTPPHYTPLQHTTFHYTTRHSITLHYTTLHYTTLHYTTLHYTTLHYTTQHYRNYSYKCSYNYNYTYTTLHNPTIHQLHYTTLSYATTLD